MKPSAPLWTINFDQQSKNQTWKDRANFVPAARVIEVHMRKAVPAMPAPPSPPAIAPLHHEHLELLEKFHSTFKDFLKIYLEKIESTSDPRLQEIKSKMRDLEHLMLFVKQWLDTHNNPPSLP